jgi:hypothetical protein
MMNTLEQTIAELNKKYPLILRTHASRLYTTVRRMKAEKEGEVSIKFRYGSAISVKTRKPANKMTKKEWEVFYRILSERLRAEYPERYSGLFPEGTRRHGDEAQG